ncbi:MAG: hypothetical protein P8M80_06785 [Pirellulaceae bacterium]|nr:hypothetical protein [Pirellulaceae bacterium]
MADKFLWFPILQTIADIPVSGIEFWNEKREAQPEKLKQAINFSVIHWLDQLALQKENFL